MKKTITFCILLVSFYSFAQINALTEDGKEVILFDGGTWKFVNESDLKTLETIIKNEGSFTKNKNATFLMKSKKLDVGIYFDPKKWKLTPQKISPNVEYFLSEREGDNGLYGFLMTEKLQVATLKNLKDLIISQVQRNVDYFRLIKSEYRTVNGMNVLYLNYTANTNGIDFEYVGNYFINSEGYSAILGFATQQNFAKNSSEIQELINGMTIAEKQKITEVIEYSSPPPPMKPKN